MSKLGYLVMKITYFIECTSCNKLTDNWLKLKNNIVLCQICEVKIFLGE